MKERTNRTNIKARITIPCSKMIVMKNEEDIPQEEEEESTVDPPYNTHRFPHIIYSFDSLD